MRRFITMFALMAMVALVAAPIQAQKPHKQTGPAQRDGISEQTNRCDSVNGNEVGTVRGGSGDDLLWPPNHKFPASPHTFVAEADEDDDGVFLETRVDVADATGGDGGPNHDPDADPMADSHSDPAGDQDDTDTAGDAETGDPDGEGTATTEHSLRAERSGKGEGREYTIEWEATFTTDDGPVTCSSTGWDVELPGSYPPFVVCVPHDMRPANRDCVA